MERQRRYISSSNSLSRRRSGTISSSRTSYTSSAYISGNAAPSVFPEVSVNPNKNYDSPKFKGRSKPSSKAVTQKQVLIAPAYKIFAVILLFALLLGVATVSFVAGNSVEMQKAEATQTQISEAREEAHALEVKLGALSNPSRIKGEAENLGMTTATDVVKINLAKDVVVLGDNGSLSLAGSLAEASK